MNSGQIRRHLVVGILMVASLVLVPARAENLCPERVRIGYYDIGIPPYLYGDGLAFQTPPGYLVDWTVKAIELTGCAVTPELRRRPIQRAKHELVHADADILASLPLSDEYLATFAYPMYKGQVDERRMLHYTETSLWILKGETSVTWDGSSLSGASEVTVGAVMGTKAEVLVRARGWHADVAPNATLAIRKLLAGRTAVLAILNTTVQGREPGDRQKLRALTPPLDRTQLYSVASKAFYAKNPEFMERYWDALCRISRATDSTPVEQQQLGRCR